MFSRIVSGRSLLAAKAVTTNTSIISRTLKSDLKIKWLRPAVVSCLDPKKSGDRQPTAEIDKSQVQLKFQLSDELKNADDIVRKQFTLEFQSLSEISSFYEKEMIDKVKRHVLDYGSMESEIARMTAKIRYLQHVVSTTARNGSTIKHAKELIEKRAKTLKWLRRWDYKRYEWLLEKLDIEYKPRPETFIMIARKEGLRRLTQIHCDDIRNSRLAEYRRNLESEQLPFLSEKLKNLEFVRNEQIDLGVEVTVSQQEIDDVRKKYEELKAKRAEIEAEKDDEGSTKKWKIH